MYEPNQTPSPIRAHPLLYVILTLLTINLAATASLWMSFRSDTSREEPKATLPIYLNQAELKRIASETQRLYNEEKYADWYETFDDLAKVQFSESDLSSQIEKLRDIIGTIEKSAYSHFVSGYYENLQGYDLFYKLDISGATFTKATMRISIIDRGDSYGVMGVFINGTTQ